MARVDVFPEVSFHFQGRLPLDQFPVRRLGTRAWGIVSHRSLDHQFQGVQAVAGKDFLEFRGIVLT